MSILGLLFSDLLIFFSSRPMTNQLSYLLNPCTFNIRTLLFPHKEDQICCLKICPLGKFYLTDLTFQTITGWGCSVAQVHFQLFSYTDPHSRSWDRPSMNQACHWKRHKWDHDGWHESTSLCLWPCLGFDPNIFLPAMINFFWACSIWYVGRNPARNRIFDSWLLCASWSCT